MATDGDCVKELDLEVERLMREVDKYRTATEDALQQPDWCIGYFAGCNEWSLVKSLVANRAYICRHPLNREEAGMPASP